MRHILAFVVLAIPLAQAKPNSQPAAPATTAVTTADPLSHVEYNKLHLTKDQDKEQYQAVMKAISPPMADSNTAYDKAGANDALARYLSWPPFWKKDAGAAWGGAQGNLVSTWLDFGDTPTELLRAARVYRCLAHDANAKLALNVDDPQQIATFAACHMDMKKLDKDAVDKEIAADTRLNDLGRAMAKDRFAVTKRDADIAYKAFEEKAAKDPAFKEIVFDFPEKVAAEWESDYAAHQKEVDEARALIHKLLDDTAGRRKTHDSGCGEPSHKALISYVQSKEPKSAADVIKAATDDVGYTLLVAATMCDAYEGRFASTRVESWLMEQGGQRLGPRGAVAYALIAEVQDRAKANKPVPFKVDNLKASQEEFIRSKAWWDGRTKVRSDDRDLYIDDTAGGAKDKKFNRGVLVAAKAGKGGAELSFKKETWKVPDYDCVKTRIINWQFDGTPIWEFSCKPSTPPFHMETNEHPKMTIGSWLASTFKPGQLVQTFTYSRAEDDLNTGFPIAVWSDKNRTKMLMAYGIPLAGGAAPAGKKKK